MASDIVQHWRRPHEIVLGVDNTLTLPLFGTAGDAITPSSVTVTIYRGSTAVVSDEAGVTGPPPSYVLGSSETSSLDPSEGKAWSVHWKPVINGVARVLRRPAIFTRFELVPQLLDEDVYRGEEPLRGFVRPTGDFPDLQQLRVDGMDMVLNDLWQAGVPVHQVTDTGRLAYLHLWKTRVLAYSTSPNWVSERMRCEAEYKAALDSLVAPVDHDHDGFEDTKPIQPKQGDPYRPARRRG